VYIDRKVQTDVAIDFLGGIVGGGHRLHFKTRHHLVTTPDVTSTNYTLLTTGLKGNESDDSGILP